MNFASDVTKNKKVYDINTKGAVVAIRIYSVESNLFPMADLVFVNREVITISWTNVTERDFYSIGINGYTFIYDERVNCDNLNRTFDSFK